MNKTRILLSALSAIFTILLTTGCQSAPTAFDEALWDIRTNYVDVVEARTNVVTIYETNLVTQTVTNTVEVEPGVWLPQVTVTETPIVSITTNTYVSLSTNRLPEYHAEPDAQLVQSAQAVGSFFGVGELAGAIVTGLLGIAGVWRFKGQQVKTAQAVNVSLVNAVETLRNIIKTTPQGAQLDTAIKSFLIEHQIEAGVFQEVVKLLESKLNSKDASRLAQSILALTKEAQQ